MTGWKEFIKETVSTILIAVLIAAVIKVFLVDNRIIPTSSMYPTIHVGDMVLVNKTAYYFGSPARGDIVVFKPPAEVGKDDLIKRVIGLPGETVEVHDEKVFIDGNPLTEDYLNETPQYQFGPVTVPEDSIFVLGDNRNESFDGHLWPEPFLKINSIKGKAFFRYWPAKRFGKLTPEEVVYEGSSNQ